MTVISRRQFGKLAAGAAAAGALAMPAIARAQGKGSVTFFTYVEYSDPALTNPFTAQTGIGVVPLNFADTDSMVSRLRVGGGDGIDLVSVPNRLSKQLFSEGLLEPIDLSRIPNWSKVFPEFAGAPFVKTDQDGTVMCVPTVWGPDGLIYRTDKIEHADSWQILWDPAYQGRIVGFDYGYEMILLAAQVLGFNEQIRKDVIAFTDEEFAAIRAKLLEQKSLVAKYAASTAEAQALIASGEAWVGIGRLAMIKPLAEENIPIKLVAPKEGAQGWCTSTAILKSSKNKDAAYEFLNYVIGDDYQTPLMLEKGYPSANKTLLMSQSQEVRDGLTMGNPNLLQDLVWWMPAADNQKINNLWNEVKAS